MSVAVGVELRERRALSAIGADYLALTKPRVIVLLEVCAAAAMVMAARGWPGTTLVLWTLIGGALAAGGANALNCWFDRDIDRTMSRTAHRPIPSGRVTPTQALTFGVALGVLSFVVMTSTVNLLAATLTSSALLFYVLVYTMYLKRSTVQNIVIGGAAGAIPPLVGWAAVTGRIEAAALFLFAIVFFWTPPHFWALAILMRGDYSQARIPMLPVVVGDNNARRFILLYSIILAVVTVLPFLAGTFGLFYLAGAVVLNGVFLTMAVAAQRDAGKGSAQRLFHFSLTYLAALFIVMAIDRIVTG